MSEVKRFTMFGQHLQEADGQFVYASDYDKQAQEIERLSAMISRDFDYGYQQAQEIERLQEEYDKQWRRAGISSQNVEALTSEVLRLTAELERVKKATVKDSLTVQPAAYAVFAANGNVMCFSTDCSHGSLKALELAGCEIRPLYTAPPAIPAVSEMELDKYGLGYPLHKEQAVQLWHKGFRSEPITVLEAWEAIGHDIGCNPSKDELFDSLRNMSEICRAHGFDTPSIPETSVVVERELLERVERYFSGFVSDEPPAYALGSNGLATIRAILSSKGDV